MNLFKKLTTVASLATCIGLAVPTISHAAVGDQTLYPGAHNNDVAQLQDILKTRGYFPSSESTGRYDSKTEKAVKSYQKEHDLSTDGIAGPNTFKAMNLENTIGPELLSNGDKDYDVTILQSKLKELGYFKGESNGTFGLSTLNAVKDLQVSKKLLVDGVVGPYTKAALDLKVVSRDTNAPQEKTKAKDDNQNKQTEQPKQQKDTAKTSPEPKAHKQQSPSTKGKTISVKSTAYTADCPGCSGKTATGLDLKAHPDAKVIAVDPSVIPLGSKVYVPGYGTAIASDTGGAIDGHIIDVYFKGKGQATSWGVKNLTVTILK